MTKRILITGATDGIGLKAAEALAAKGHSLILHGRNPEKLESVQQAILATHKDAAIETISCDLSKLSDVLAFSRQLGEQAASLDVLINNAGVYRTSDPINADGLDIRFVVNTIAPYVLAQAVLPGMGASGRIINVSSAAQAPVDVSALKGETHLGEGSAYAQSKLAIIMWTNHLTKAYGPDSPVLVSVNPGSLLGSKMVKEAFGIAGGDVGKGADILCRAALSQEFDGSSGQYFDNDSGRFAPPHPDALTPAKCESVVNAIEDVLSRFR